MYREPVYEAIRFSRLVTTGFRGRAGNELGEVIVDGQPGVAPKVLVASFGNAKTNTTLASLITECATHRMAMYATKDPRKLEALGKAAQAADRKAAKVLKRAR